MPFFARPTHVVGALIGTYGPGGVFNGHLLPVMFIRTIQQQEAQAHEEAAQTQEEEAGSGQRATLRVLSYNVYYNVHSIRALTEKIADIILAGMDSFAGGCEGCSMEITSNGPYAHTSSSLSLPTLSAYCAYGDNTLLGAHAEDPDVVNLQVCSLLVHAPFSAPAHWQHALHCHPRGQLSGSDSQS